MTVRKTKTPAEPVACGAWRDEPPMNEARHGSFSLVVLSDGAVLVRGGTCYGPRGGERAVRVSELRDPATGLWRVVPRAIAEELARGGRETKRSTGVLPWTRWSDDKLDQYAYPRSASLNVALDDGSVLVACGFQSTDGIGPFEGSDENELSTVLHRASDDPRWRYAGHMLGPRLYAAAVKLPGGRVLIAGGTEGGRRSLSSVEIWEPA